MPVVFRYRGYRGWFYEADLAEPPHVHVGKEGKEAKYWLAPIRLARAGRFNDQDLRDVERILRKFQDDILTKWEEEKTKYANG